MKERASIVKDKKYVIVGGIKIPIKYLFSEKNWMPRKTTTIKINHTGP
jgi:hypothetical protein